MAADNASLGEFNLSGLPPAPRGVPKIEVALRYRCERYPERRSQRHGDREISVDPHHGLDTASETEKRRLVEEAERYAEADKKRREEADKARCRATRSLTRRRR